MESMGEYENMKGSEKKRKNIRVRRERNRYDERGKERGKEEERGRECREMIREDGRGGRQEKC